MRKILTNGQNYEAVVLVDANGNLASLSGSSGSSPLSSDTNSIISSSTTSTVLAAANSLRRGLTIYNNSTSNLHVCHGATATIATAKYVLSGKVPATGGVVEVPGGFYEMPTTVYTGIISGIWDAVDGSASVYEGV